MRQILVLVSLAYCLNAVSARTLHVKCSTDTDSDFNCPYPSGLFPHEVCGKFWHCSNCIAYEKNCPANLVWDRLYQTCNWPQDVDITDCTVADNGNSTVTATGPTDATTDASEGTTGATDTEGTTEADNTTGPASDATTSGSSDENTTEAPEQPTTGASEEPTTGASEEPTTGATEEPTTGPSDDQTTEGEGSETTEGTTEDTTEGTTEETTEGTTDETTDGSTGTPPEDTTSGSEPVCQPDQQYYPHADCRKFWQCSNDVAIEQNCAPATAWDQDILTCNHEALVDC